MAPWRNLNTRGKVLVVACLFNMWVAVVLALDGLWESTFSVLVAAICGILTFKKRYQHQDAKDINEGREE
jgi:hypothetical protein